MQIRRLAALSFYFLRWDDRARFWLAAAFLRRLLRRFSIAHAGAVLTDLSFSEDSALFHAHLVMVVDVDLVVVKTCTSSDSRLYHQAD